MKKIISTAIACVSIASAHAEITTTSVFCATPDGSYWNWLVTNDGNRVPISGEWGRSTNPEGAYFDYFTISEESYNFLKSACQLIFVSEYVPQPSDSFSGEWYVFLVNRPDGSQYLADGKYGLTSRQLQSTHLPSSAFRL